METGQLVRCGGCGREGGHEPSAVKGLFYCGCCGGLIGQCAENVLHGMTTDRELGPLCAACANEVGTSRAAERRYQAQYAYACGYHD